MAKVSKPLFSQKASGDFADVIQFVCGQFTRGKPSVNDKKSASQRKQRTKFDEGVVVWSYELSKEQKEDWKLFKLTVLLSPKCVQEVYRMSGFNLFMSYYLNFGVDGWPNYPNPPF